MINRAAISDDLPFLHFFSFLYNRLLMETRILVCPHEILQRIVVIFRAGSRYGFYPNMPRVNLLHCAIFPRHLRKPRIFGYPVFVSSANQRRLRAQKRHRLALHIRTHERAVRVIISEKRNERSRNRYKLLG